MCEIRTVCPPQATSTFFSNVNAITGSNLVPSVPGVIGAHIPALGTCVLRSLRVHCQLSLEFLELLVIMLPKLKKIAVI